MRVGRLRIRRRPNLLGTAARTAAIAGAATAVTSAMRRRNHHSHAAAPGISDDQLGRLERLAGLRTSGVLSDEEFETEKAEILGRTPSA